MNRIALDTGGPMAALLTFWKAYSARLASIVMAIAAAGLISGTVGKAIGIVVPLLLGQAVHSTVFAPATVVERVTQAASSVAGQLTAESAGVAGMVTTPGQAVVDGVVAGVLGQGS